MTTLALFVILGALTGVAIVIARQRLPEAGIGVYGRTALLSLALTTVVAVAAQLAANLLWVERGELGMPALGPAMIACSGFVPAFIAGLVLYPIFVRIAAAEGKAVLSLLGGLFLAGSVAVLAVVLAQATMELRAELPRAAFLVLLFGTQSLLLAAPALGFATVAWDIKAQHTND